MLVHECVCMCIHACISTPIDFKSWIIQSCKPTILSVETPHSGHSSSFSSSSTRKDVRASSTCTQHYTAPFSAAITSKTTKQPPTQLLITLDTKQTQKKGRL